MEQLHFLMHLLYQVDGGQQAVLFDCFHKVIDETVGEGTHFFISWSQKPFIFDIRMRPRTFSSISALDKFEVQSNKMKATGGKIEYKCLIRATDGKEMISTTLNIPNNDAPSQLVKRSERNTRYVDAVLTITMRTLVPKCGMNLAFNRELIRPNNVFWFEGKANNPFVNLKKEYKTIYWQEELIPLFQLVTLPKDCNTVQKCYIELSNYAKTKLGKVDDYFVKLLDGMVTWIQAWDDLNPSSDGFCNGSSK